NSPEQAIEGVISTTIQNLTPQNISASEGSIGAAAPALQAAETGATSTATPEGMIETRSVINRQHIAESSVESFYSRAGLVGMVKLEGLQSSTFTTWTIDTMGFVQQRRKLELFTYMRFDAEFTMLVCAAEEINPYNIQYMYVPPGSGIPTDHDSYLWQSGTNPSIYVKSTDPPAQFSIPFMSTCAAYAWFYDGYPRSYGPDAEALNKSYGILPANQFGTFCMRLLGSALKTTLTVRIYMRPKHIKCWAPRPFRMLPYVEKNRPSYKSPPTDPIKNRTSITTT
nr:1D (VP1) [Enterovirus J]